jgi:hypothetical protein
MPRGDQTGPAGMGPMTGRAAGYCAGYSTPGFANPAFGAGMGFGWGRGRGFGWGRGGGFGRGRGMRWGAPYAGYGYGAPYPYATTPYAAAPTPQQELSALKSEAKFFENSLNEIQQRIAELKAEKAASKEKKE